MNTMQLSDLRTAAEYHGVDRILIYRGYSTGFKWEITAVLKPTRLIDDKMTVVLSSARGNVRRFTSLDSAYRVVSELGEISCFVHEAPTADEREEQLNIEGL